MARRAPWLPLLAVGLACLAVCAAVDSAPCPTTKPGCKLPPPAKAGSRAKAPVGVKITGTVSGFMGDCSTCQNRFDGAEVNAPWNWIPAGFGNSNPNLPYNVPIGVAPNGEFGYYDGNQWAVKITGDQLVITFTTAGYSIPLFYEFVFSDAIDATLVSSNWPNWNSWTSPSKIYIDFTGYNGPAGTFVATFNLESTTPICNSAPLPPPVKNAGGWDRACVSGSFAGAQCAATCRTGYRSAPTPVITCQAGGTWSAPSSSECRRACESSPTEPLSGGTWVGCAGTPVRGRCFGSCDSGLNGSPYRECGAGGYRPQIGKCVPKPVCLGLPSAKILNGAWPLSCWDSTAGTTCTATCNPGYSGSATITCDPPAPGVKVDVGADWSRVVVGSCRR